MNLFGNCESQLRYYNYAEKVIFPGLLMTAFRKLQLRAAISRVSVVHLVSNLMPLRLFRRKLSCGLCLSLLFIFIRFPRTKTVDRFPSLEGSSFLFWFPLQAAPQVVSAPGKNQSICNPFTN